ncbi:RelA/SpoT domain-containing protein [Nitrosomonas sp. Nm33]|uniref:RelA/SpoT domain-containing protein n=1 Tax=Nitrosomonas sp. Nm33 TaxID=133724 RepID=UPI000B2CC51D|nr:RelA/SpoT domain-containing protein [Nitrosomonas sp. Nm33]
MNLDDYEKKYFPIYKAFAETVRFILEKALLVTENLPRPQSIQCRAKEIESLRRRLTELGKLDTQTLELDRRDLAGVRLIFYTNNDVDHFLASPLIRENFEIEEDSTKVHHPTLENKRVRYRAIHYTVRLREDRTHLPEYAKFADLRCEIQIQTILNHAWSETSHDPIYKAEMGNGTERKLWKAFSVDLSRLWTSTLYRQALKYRKLSKIMNDFFKAKSSSTKTSPTY